ncbi:hypothetical protein ABIE27_000120 [Paenibacillus sp. 4624]|jgi:hypothetical protein
MLFSYIVRIHLPYCKTITFETETVSSILLEGENGVAIRLSFWDDKFNKHENDVVDEEGQILYNQKLGLIANDESYQ